MFAAVGGKSIERYEGATCDGCLALVLATPREDEARTGNGHQAQEGERGALCKEAWTTVR